MRKRAFGKGAYFILTMLAILLLAVLAYRQKVGWFAHAVRYGHEPRAFVMVRSLLDKAEQTKQLSDREFADLVRYADHNDPFIRVRVLTALFYLGETPHANEAREVAKARLSDSEWLVRVYALRALHRLQEPDITQIARKMADDVDVRVKEEAQKILQRRAR